MIKKIFFALTLVFGFAACTEDYTDWTESHTNPQHDAAASAELAVTPTVNAVNFQNEQSDSIQLFTATINNGTTTGYTVEFAGNDKATILEVPLNGKVATADIHDMVKNMYGPAFYERQLTVTASAIVKNNTEDGVVSTRCNASPYTLSVTLERHEIAQNYYLVGGPEDWFESAKNKDMKFSHSGKDVYEDPVFTYELEGGKDMWFAFGDDDACDAIANPAGGDWSRLFGTAGGSDDLTGSFDRRSVLGGDHSLHVDGSADGYLITINMMDMTYEIKPLHH